MEITVDQQDDNHEVQRPTDCPVQVDESTDDSDLSILLVIARYLNVNELEENLLLCYPLTKRCTGEDIFNAIQGYFCGNEIDWAKCCGVCTDGGKSMSGRYKALRDYAETCLFHGVSRLIKKRLRNIVDNADRKAHNLYLNHAQATPNEEYVYYEDEETDCSSDISEVILNLNTYKPSTSNRLISFTDHKYKQLTPFLAKSSQMRLGLPSTPVVGDRCGVYDRAVAAIASSVLHHIGLITSNNSDLVVDENKLRREKLKLERI
ncbi:hypothetical protein AVEN_9032-1 [Araneus ventricosus]|uniref:Zinc finger BED domain-containing protein 5 n=1 Tax=Araneus ventricosus TaxID=182803 RepID=A0A4Y2QE34_ARAVE|nr:hypothetical protein AVEN_9032-1 [Araneus ventricosus]